MTGTQNSESGMTTGDTGRKLKIVLGENCFGKKVIGKKVIREKLYSEKLLREKGHREQSHSGKWDTREMVFGKMVGYQP